MLITHLGLRAQTASISGRVEDPSGAAVADAIVTVTNAETGASRVVHTDSAGSFRVLSLPVGQHEVKVEKSGFKTAVCKSVALAVGQETALELRLSVGDVVQEITVSEYGPVINTTTAPVSGLVGEREIKDLPLNGRSFDNLITLNPGTVNYSALRSAHTSTSNGNAFSVAGRRPGDNLFLLNGIEYTGSSILAVTPGGVSGNLLGIDAVREFNVLTDTYGAQYGKRDGAQISAVTQSGTNVLHGSVFEFLRNSALDARNFFDGGSVPPFRQNQFGAAAGGPLVRNRLFVFGNYEGFRQSLAVSGVSVVPDTCARQLIGNCVVPNPNPAMLPYMVFWPQPNGRSLGDGTALSFNNPRQTVREDFGTTRLDGVFGRQDSVAVAYTIDDGESLLPQADPLFGSGTSLRSQVLSLEETHVFSPRLLNSFSVGFSRAAFDFDSFPLTAFSPSLSFIRGAGPGGIVIGGGVTTTGVGAITPAGPNNAAGVSNRRNLFTYTDRVQLGRGAHQISAGVWLQRLQDNEDTASRRLGQASFASLKSFLQGIATSFQAVPSPTELGWRSLLAAWYFEDAIKLRRNLNVRAGVRHEFTTGWNEVAGRAANFVTGAQGALVTTPRIGDSIFTRNNARRLFSPRIGIAWDIFGDGSTVLRAGYGTYYSLLDALSFQLNSNPPFNGAISFNNVALTSVVPISTAIALPPPCGPNVPRPCTTYAPQGVQADAKTPTVQEWNLALERALGRNTALRLSYVGSFGYHGLISLDPNSIPARICDNLSGCLAGGMGTQLSTVPAGTEYVPVGSRPNPFLGAGFFWYSAGNSSYNALQADVAHQFSRQLQFRANYTWSKNLDTNSGLTGAQSTNQPQMVLDRTNLRRDWGPSALNLAHQGHISAVYQLPFGRGRRWLAGTQGIAGKMISGWQFNEIATIASGFPFTPQIGSNRSGNGDTRNPDRPSWNPAFSGPVVLHNPNQWFNPSAFSTPAPGTFGNVGRGSLTGPGLVEVDASLFKDTALWERATLQFRAEIFNVLNHANFAPPNPIVSAGSAGLITATATSSRQVQFGLKLMF